MSTKAKPCWTCAAMVHTGFTIELAHVSGMAIGILLAGGHSVAEARALATATLCEEHERDLRVAAALVGDSLRDEVGPS